MIRTIMDCADQTIQLFGELDIIGTKDPPVIDILSQKVLAALPRLKKTYDSWWLAKKAELERDYSLATSKRSWPYISAHLHNAAPFMLATHKRNLDFDCKDIPELEFAPKTTDTTESSFSCVDSAIKSNGAEGGIYSCFGVAQAKIMHFLQTPGEKRKRAEEQYRSSQIADKPALVAKKLREWDVTSFFQLKREDRWEIIKDIRKKNQTNLCRRT